MFGSPGGVTPPPSRIFADSAVLLFLAMPMLAVGGILFLITNLQVRGGRGRRRDLGGGGGRHKPPLLWRPLMGGPQLEWQLLGRRRVCVRGPDAGCLGCASRVSK